MVRCHHFKGHKYKQIHSIVFKWQLPAHTNPQTHTFRQQQTNTQLFAHFNKHTQTLGIGSKISLSLLTASLYSHQNFRSLPHSLILFLSVCLTNSALLIILKLVTVCFGCFYPAGLFLLLTVLFRKTHALTVASVVICLENATLKCRFSLLFFFLFLLSVAVILLLFLLIFHD